MKNRFKNWKPPVIKHGKPTKWNWIVLHPENLVIKKRVDIGTFTFIQAQEGVVLESDVELGPFVYICSASTIDGKKGKVILKAGAKIGAHSSIMPGVTIGKNSIIGAHSFVNRDIPDNVVAFGVPAKVVRPIK